MTARVDLDPDLPLVLRENNARHRANLGRLAHSLRRAGLEEPFVQTNLRIVMMSYAAEFQATMGSVCGCASCRH